MNRCRQLFCLIIAICPLFLFAGNICEAPAPASGSVTEVGSDFISIQWSAVPGALSYEVTTIDGVTAMAVDVTVVTTTNFTQDNLLPGTDYDLQVRASYCAAGDYGNPLFLEARTEVVIVDIILQMNCNDNTPGVTTETIAAGNTKTFDFNNLPGGCFDVHATTVLNNQTVTYDFTLSESSADDLLFSNYNGNPSGFQLYGNGPLLGTYAASSNMEGVPIFQLNAIQQPGQYKKATVKWLDQTTITTTACNDCRYVTGGGRNLTASTQEEPSASNSFEIAPNPVNSSLSVNRPATTALRIWDINGRPFLELPPSSAFDTSSEIDVSTWPAGTYLIEWRTPNAPPTRKYFVKL